MNILKELVAPLLVLAAMGGLYYKIADMNGTLGGVRADVTSTEERVQRIAQALPDVGVRVADEEITRPIRTVVMAGMPTKKNNGQYQMAVTVIDVSGLTKWTYPITLKRKDDKSVISALAWSGYQHDQNFAQFSKMAAYSRFAKFDSSLPASVDANSSFVLSSTAADDLQLIEPLNGINPVKSSFSDKVTNWKDLVEALKKHQPETEPKK